VFVPQRRKLYQVVPFVSRAYYLLHAGFLLDLFFDPEDGSDVFLRSVG
jgi:hypothetical protein